MEPLFETPVDISFYCKKLTISPLRLPVLLVGARGVDAPALPIFTGEDFFLIGKCLHHAMFLLCKRTVLDDMNAVNSQIIADSIYS